MSDDDEPQLTPANEKPWYWLATMYGEPKEESNWWDADEALAEKNRKAWNRWMASSLPAESYTKLITNGFDASELSPLSDIECNEFCWFSPRAHVKRMRYRLIRG